MQAEGQPQVVPEVQPEVVPEVLFEIVPEVQPEEVPKCVVIGPIFIITQDKKSFMTFFNFYTNVFNPNH